MKYLNFKNHTVKDTKKILTILGLILLISIFITLPSIEINWFKSFEKFKDNPEVLTSIVYFAIININIILILLLGFLIFRNIVKLVLERKHGILGSKLKTKLVVTLIFFSIAPTTLMFIISSNFINQSFDKLFSKKVQETIKQTKETGTQIYRQDQQTLEQLALLALNKLTFYDDMINYNHIPKINFSALKNFAKTYKLDSLKIYNELGQLIWTSETTNLKQHAEYLKVNSKIVDIIMRFKYTKGLISKGIVESEDNKDVVRGIVPIIYPQNNQILGILVTEKQYEKQILKSIENILNDFVHLKPTAKIYKTTYTIILIIMVLVIIFASTWLGFAVSKGIVSPIQNLAEVTKEVALGNYNVSLNYTTDDETGALIKAFNQMINDLKIHEANHIAFTKELQQTNEEIERRKKYMEVILQNISAGVIAVDSNGKITSFNNAAENLLQKKSSEVIGYTLKEALGDYYWEKIWNPILEKLNIKFNFNGQFDLEKENEHLKLLISATKIFDENHENKGIVFVINDASEQLKLQRVAAWREVARRVAHEIKNPITPIKLSTQRLLRRYKDTFTGDDKNIFHSCIQTILLQVDSLKYLVDEFSKFSRLPTIHPTPQNLNTIIIDAANFFKLSYPKINFDTSSLSSNLPLIMLDKDQIHRVIVNLVNNAINAIENNKEYSSIVFKTSFIDSLNAVRLEIADNGCGMSHNIKQHVLEPYFSTKKEGMGLGLSIVNQIISEHGGYIRFADNIPRGTIVIIDFPIQDKLYFKETII